MVVIFELWWIRFALLGALEGNPADGSRFIGQ
jgi:hypothetical protein